MELFIKKEKNSKTRIHKKVFLMTAISLLLIMSLLTGCGNNVKNDATQLDDISSEAPVISVRQNTDTENPSYQITAAEINQDNIVIKYPQIEGLGNDSVEQAINELIKTDIWDSQVNNIMKSYQEDGSTINLNIDLKYEVTISTDKLLSIMYTGTSYVEGGMYVNNVLHGLTIDLISGNRLSLADFTKIDTGLIKEMKQSKEVTNEAVKSADNDKQATEIRNCLITEIQGQEDQDIIPELEKDNDNFYVTQKSLIIRVGVSSAAGGYALVEIPRN